MAILAKKRTWGMRVRLLGISLFLGAFVGCASNPNNTTKQVPRLWKSIASSIELPQSPETVRAMPIEVRASLITSSENVRFLIPVPGGRLLTVVKEWQERVGDDGFVWHGKVEKDPESLVTLSVVNKSIMGTIITANRNFYRLTQAKGNYFIEEVNPSKIPITIEGNLKFPAKFSAAVAPTDIFVRPSPPPFLTCPPPNATVIDVMVLFTVDALNEAGGKDDIKTIAAHAIGETNQSFCNSKVNLQLHLVHSGVVSYPDNGEVDRVAALLALQNNEIDDTSGHSVGVLRNSYHADVVVLLVKNTQNGASGSTYFDGTPSHAFSVVVLNQATGNKSNYSFAHELGHIMGANHDRNDPIHYDGEIDTGYNYGHGQPTTSDQNKADLSSKGITWYSWRTIMATNNKCHDCKRMLYWPNPNVSYLGDPTGIPPIVNSPGSPPLPEDNHRILNITGPVISGFRP